jgi:hypothetical protein
LSYVSPEIASVLVRFDHAVDPRGRTIWIVDANGCGKRFVVCVDEILTAFIELQRAIHEFALSLLS